MSNLFATPPHETLAFPHYVKTLQHNLLGDLGRTGLGPTVYVPTRHKRALRALVVRHIARTKQATARKTHFRRRGGAQGFSTPASGWRRWRAEPYAAIAQTVLEAISPEVGTLQAIRWPIGGNGSFPFGVCAKQVWGTPPRCRQS